jgi:hypothetical protein
MKPVPFDSLKPGDWFRFVPDGTPVQLFKYADEGYCHAVAIGYPNPVASYRLPKNCGYQAHVEERVERVNIRSILADPEQRRELMVDSIVALQAREGVETTREQAETAYDAVLRERGEQARACETCRHVGTSNADEPCRSCADLVRWEAAPSPGDDHADDERRAAQGA